MPFEGNVRVAVDSYARSDLRSRQWHSDYFDFIDEPALRVRLGEEFFTARYLYKVFEGLAAEGELQIAQVRLQVLQYASIYEAALHHLLFSVFPDHSLVQKLRDVKTLKRYSIPPDKQSIIDSVAHDGKAIIPAYLATTRVSETKIRFDDKASCARELGLLEPWLCKDLIEIYEARNAIHLHAEMRKGMFWELELARTAYRRHEPFRSQIMAGIAKLKS